MLFRFTERITDVTYRSDSGRPTYFPEARYGMGNNYAASYSGSNMSSPARSQTSPMGPPPGQEFPSPTSVGSPPPAQQLPACVEQFNSAAAAGNSTSVATDSTLPSELLQPGATGSLTLRTSATEHMPEGFLENILSDYQGQELDDVSMAQLNTNSFYTVTTMPQSSGGSNAAASSPAMANGI